jgi:hypothetical protein
MLRTGVESFDISAAPGEPSTVYSTLSDWKQRFYTGTLSWSFANGVGDLGLDVGGSEKNNTRYYMYEVPKTGDDDQITVVASENFPTSGPAGRSCYKYLFPFYNDSIGNISLIEQVDECEFQHPLIEPAASVAFGTAFQDPKVEISVADVVPPTASQMIVVCHIGVGTADPGHSLNQAVYIFGEPYVSWQSYVAAQDQYERSFGSVPVPIRLDGGVPKIGYRSWKDAGILTINLQHIYCVGFKDKYRRR